MAADPEIDSVRVLSIQSHVVHGYVGNRSAVFPLQLLGFEVDAINSVQFSTHTWYKVWKGSVMNDEDLDVLYQGLKAEHLHHYDYILTGYIGSESFLRKVNQIIKEMKIVNPKLKFVCDPVMGDEGVLYVPESLLEIYQKETLALADIILPNQFEAEKLTGLTVSSEEAATRVMDTLHKMGPNTVVLSSSSLGSDGSCLVGYASQKHDVDFKRVRMEIPKLDIQFIGTGDLFAALWLAWSHRQPTDLNYITAKVQSTMHHVLTKTFAAAKRVAGDKEPSFADRELRLVQCRKIIENPEIVDSVKVVSI